MRLTHLKLAGFKSFVDPTTLHIHGQRVGVVGPNGCGKSNVMESVRWVLGESSAREMRGDSMQDVIFNGSGNRKPVSRASVELLFDNRLGGAAGEWSQYAEISVKRVLQRDSGSTYYINNTPVRRRDVADLFLGTGLGGRAYAIIGQNTITRIVEAKPEELRVYLEEAAGISKYKERRRETELRLRDTRDNLTRAEDIRRELGNQIARLESQAVVAQQYHDLRHELAVAHGQLWLLKKREAAHAWEKSQRQVERLVNDLEAQTAGLRGTENILEQLRLEHYAAGEAVQAAQGRYYEANAQVSSLEQQLRHTQENRERLSAQLTQIESEQEKAGTQQQDYTQQLEQQRSGLAEAAQAARLAQEALKATHDSLPIAEQAYRDAQAAFSQVQTSILQAEQQIQLERTHLEHARKSRDELSQRQQRLADEASRLVLPDDGLLQAKEAESAGMQAQLAQLETESAQLVEAEQAQTKHLKKLQHEALQTARQIAQCEAQLAALQKMQRTLEHEGNLERWLRQSGVNGERRLWQFVRIEQGWETALEGLLGARLNAVMADVLQGFGSQRPPAAVVLYGAGNSNAPQQAHPQGWRSLVSCVVAADPHAAGVLDDWLAGAYRLEDGTDPHLLQKALRPGELLVNRAGDVYTRHSVALYAAQSSLHGVLERQSELAQLTGELPDLKQNHHRQEAGLHAAEHGLHSMRRQIVEKQHAQRQATATGHALHMEVQRLQQQLQHALERQQQLSGEQAKIAQQRTEIEVRLGDGERAIQSMQEKIITLRDARDQAGRSRQDAEATLKQARDLLIEAERTAQQQSFNEKFLSNNIDELLNKIKSIGEHMEALSGRLSQARSMLQSVQSNAMKSSLEQALQHQQQCEQALAGARNALAGTEQRLQETERNRLQTEQQLHPMRDRLEQARLQEQQARLAFEHCAAQLDTAGLDEAVLAEGLDKVARSADLEQHGAVLEARIAELGPVNLGAIQEVAIEKERKIYLDSQSQDLEEAVLTLEEAIRRIDRETRSRLQHTYDEANRHFGELFSTLFGGGEAQLQLTGEEILDTGVQVYARPPGKKNNTIHLLSGGEKALTALALVFALFRLNPAPFCLMDEVDAPLDDSNTERFCTLVRKMSESTQFLFVSHNKITMEMAQQLIGVTMQESGVSRIVEVDIEAAGWMQTEIAA
jgi:chromosome segregation protein